MVWWGSEGNVFIFAALPKSCDNQKVQETGGRRRENVGVDSFPQEVVEVLRCYVYRLIDPRNGETFYVGRGKEQRVFDHVSGAVDKADHDALDPKLGRIHEIRALDMDVAHIIHRHGDVGGGCKRGRGGADRRLSWAGEQSGGFRIERPGDAACG